MLQPAIALLMVSAILATSTARSLICPGTLGAPCYDLTVRSPAGRLLDACLSPDSAFDTAYGLPFDCAQGSLRLNRHGSSPAAFPHPQVRHVQCQDLCARIASVLACPGDDRKQV